MTDIAFHAGAYHGRSTPMLDHKTGRVWAIVFFSLLAAGIGYGVHSLMDDIRSVHEPLALGVFALLGIALVIALGFEFVNGFHDTANAVATVIYTQSMRPAMAVAWSGCWNLLGVLVSTGAVAYSVITLLPVELVLQLGSGIGYAMIFALLIAAVVWNLFTWALAIPNSSSHALIGSIMGVGLANHWMAPGATSGVDWGQATGIFSALFWSPVMGFVFAAALLLVMKTLARMPKRDEASTSQQPPPWWIRGLLIFTCTGVSFAHGGNDGQKGMGLIMLILIGAAPTAYALNRAMPANATPSFIATAASADEVFQAHAGSALKPSPAEARASVDRALRDNKLTRPEVFASLSVLTNDIVKSLQSYGAISHVPAAATPNLRNEMYLTSAAVRLLPKSGAAFNARESRALSGFGASLEKGTRFIPLWVKICVAIALGLGTMVGWKRIVVTVGERIGKTHLTYAQGASAELVAAGTIMGAQYIGLPVSTTHILTSGIAGTMAANGSGLQWRMVRSIVLTWVTTLPAAMALAAGLYFLLRQLV